MSLLGDLVDAVSALWRARQRDEGRVLKLVHQAPTRQDALRTVRAYLVAHGPLRRSGGLSAGRLVIEATVSRSFHQRVLDDATRNPDMAAVQWTLASGHDEPDICDDYADRGSGSGLDRGVYWLDDVPPIPAHPWCRCSLEPVANDALPARLRAEATQRKARRLIA